MLFDPNNLVVMQIYNFIEEGLAESESVLIHSLEGISRCSACVVPYLMYKYHWGFEKTFEFVCSKRPDLAPNPGFMQQLFLLDKRLQQKWLKSSSDEAYVRKRLFEWGYTAPKMLRNEDGTETENDEQLLVNSYSNSQSKLTALPQPDLPVVDKANFKLRWLDQMHMDPQQARSANANSSPVRRSTRQSSPGPSGALSPGSASALHRPPNSSYSSLQCGPGWVDNFQVHQPRPGQQGGSTGRPGSAKKRPLKSILKGSVRGRNDPKPAFPNSVQKRDDLLESNSAASTLSTYEPTLDSEDKNPRLNRNRSSQILPDPKASDSKRNELYDYIGIKAQPRTDPVRRQGTEYSKSDATLSNRTESSALSSLALESSDKKGSVVSDTTGGDEDMDSKNEIERLVKKFAAGVVAAPSATTTNPAYSQGGVRASGFRDSFSSSGDFDMPDRIGQARTAAVRNTGEYPGRGAAEKAGKNGAGNGGPPNQAWMSSTQPVMNTETKNRATGQRPQSAGSQSIETVEPPNFLRDSQALRNSSVTNASRSEYRPPSSQQGRQPAVNNYLENQQAAVTSTLPKNIHSSITTQDHLLPGNQENLLNRSQGRGVQRGPQGNTLMSTFTGGPVKATAASFPGGGRGAMAQTQPQTSQPQQWAQQRQSLGPGAGSTYQNTYPSNSANVSNSWAAPSGGSARSVGSNGSSRSTGEPQQVLGPDRSRDRNRPASPQTRQAQGQVRSNSADNRGRARGGPSPMEQLQQQQQQQRAFETGPGKGNPQTRRTTNAPPVYRHGSPAPRARKPVPTTGPKSAFERPTATAMNRQHPSVLKRDPSPGPATNSRSSTQQQLQQQRSSSMNNTARYTSTKNEPISSRRGRSASPAPREKISGIPTNRRRSPSPATDAFITLSSSQQPRWK